MLDLYKRVYIEPNSYRGYKQYYYRLLIVCVVDVSLIFVDN
jgi:hypothetical protein